MKAKEIYEKETGNNSPTNQIAYNEWYFDYVEWLEKQVLALRQPTVIKSVCVECGIEHTMLPHCTNPDCHSGK